MSETAALDAAIGQTSNAVAEEMQIILDLVGQEKIVSSAEGLVLLVRGAAAASFEALSEGSRERAIPRLTRLAAGAWLLLIMLQMSPEDASVTAPR